MVEGSGLLLTNSWRIARRGRGRAIVDHMFGDPTCRALTAYFRCVKREEAHGGGSREGWPERVPGWCAPDRLQKITREMSESIEIKLEDLRDNMTFHLILVVSRPLLLLSYRLRVCTHDDEVGGGVR